MKFQDQIYFSEWVPYNDYKFYMKGNCMMACYASYFDFKIEHVPQIQFLFDCVQDRYFWQEVLDLWLKKLGYEMFNCKDEPITDDYYFAYGMSPRITKHQVIYKDGKMVFDPHPSREGLKKIEGYIILEKIK